MPGHAANMIIAVVAVTSPMLDIRFIDYTTSLLLSPRTKILRWCATREEEAGSKERMSVRQAFFFCFHYYFCRARLRQQNHIFYEKRFFFAIDILMPTLSVLLPDIF